MTRAVRQSLELRGGKQNLDSGQPDAARVNNPAAKR
jgi:hypothetical protein